MRFHGLLTPLLLLALTLALAAAGSTRPASMPGSAPASRPATQTAPADDAKVKELLRQLGDKDFKVREESTRKLALLGPAVRPALEAKLKEKDLDPEVAWRIRGILDDMPGVPGVPSASVVMGGIVVSIDDKGAVAGTREGKMLWKTTLAQPATGLTVDRGRVVIHPGNVAVDPETGRVMERR